jgi:hypothetical protein
MWEFYLSLEKERMPVGRLVRVEMAVLVEGLLEYFLLSFTSIRCVDGASDFGFEVRSVRCK